MESGIENFEQLLKYPSNKLSIDQQNPHNLKISLKVSNKTSLIDRFLRNITQKKILESKLHANDFYVKKLNSEKQVLKDLYVKRARPKKELCDSLDEEIKREIEQNSPVRRRDDSGDSRVKKLAHKNELGEVGSDCYGILNKAHFRDKSEILQKVSNNIYQTILLHTIASSWQRYFMLDIKNYENFHLFAVRSGVLLE